MTYPYEFKLQVVGEYRASGLSYREACDRISHFPSSESLSKWDKQFKRDGIEVPTPEVRGKIEHRKHQRIPEATKREALRLISKGESTRTVARRLGISSGAIKNWMHKQGNAGMKTSQKVMSMSSSDKQSPSDKAYAQIQKENEDLKLQLRVLMAMMDDPKSGGQAKAWKRRVVAFGERLRKESGLSLKSLTTSMHISRSTWEYTRRILTRTDPDGALRQRVLADFIASNRRYGYRRIHAQIAQGLDGRPAMRVSEKRVLRAMRTQSLTPRRRGAKPYSSYAGEIDERPDNIPKQRAKARRDAGEDFRKAHDFSASHPFELAVTDVTEFKLGSFKAYLSPVIDCFDGMPSSWSISMHPDSELCDSSLSSYLDKRPDDHGELVAHSDGGICYRSASWKGLCERSHVTRSMSRKATCPDNARAEGFFGTLKKEFFYGRNWTGITFKDFRKQLDDYLKWYCDGRLKAFKDKDGRTYYETIVGRRKRLGYAL